MKAKQASKGIVLSAPDATIEAKAKNLKLPVTIDPALPLAYEKVLFVEPGTAVPWDLLPAAWHFLERWDAAVPLWRYGTNASEVGTSEERKRTKAIVRDLRVPLHACELLFVRRNEAGQALMDAFGEEMTNSPERRLAFLRAYYRVKPRCCVLPRSWLAEASKQTAALFAPSRKRPKGSRLVQVEVAPGQFVKCRPGDEEKVVEQYAQRQPRRRR